jgi:hypothetical protein
METSLGDYLVCSTDNHMYGAAAVIASLAHDPLRQSTICSPVAAILQYFADNRAKPATTCFELPSGRRRAGKPAPSAEANVMP